MKSDFDYIVAGSGAAGAAVASRLSRGGARVLLLEQGASAQPQADAAAAVSLYYANAGLTAAFGNGLFPIAVGRCLGGTTAINSGTCLRPPQDAVLRWQGEAPGFDAPAFDLDVEDAWKTLKVSPVPRELAGRSTELFFRGLERRGLGGGHLLDRAHDDCRGAGRCCFVCPNDAKMTSERAFLRKTDHQAGPEVWAETRLLDVQPSQREGGPAFARIRGSDGEARTLSCRALILSCGALATPYFLRKLGLPAGVGLTIHPAAKVFALFPEPVRGWKGVPQAGGRLDPEEPRLRFEGAFVPPEMAPLTMPLEGLRLRWWLDRYENVASFGFMVRDLGRGSVRYPAGDSLPLIRYRLHEDDVRLLARGMREVARTYLAAGASRVLLPLNRPDNEIEDQAGLDAFNWQSIRAAELNTMGFHPLGTCGLGRSLGADLRAAPGLYVCDGSVVPESLGVNPQITIYAFALGLARRLLAGAGAS